MPEMNGLDALIVIRTEFPGAKVIVLTTDEGDVHILRALKAGAQGYLLKNTLHSELLHTIRAVHAGKRSLSPEVSFQVADYISDQARHRGGPCIASHRRRERKQVDCGSARHHGGHRQGASQEHSCETRRQRPDACGDHRPEERDHPAVDSRRAAVATDPKESLPAAPWGISARAATTNNRVEVRVATLVFHVRRRLARHRSAGHAPGCRLRLLWEYGTDAVECPAVTHDTHLRVAGDIGTLLVAGLWTPVVGAVVAVIQISQFLRVDEHPLVGLLAGTIAAALAMLGPGHWSVDARLFGWKRIDSPCTGVVRVG